jgi:hypothetical protein
MIDLPYFVDSDDAVEYWLKSVSQTDIGCVHVVATLSSEGYSNKAIRHALKLSSIHKVSHCLRVGASLDETMMHLWAKNSDRIHFGHIRAICRLPLRSRESAMRDLLLNPVSVRELESRVRGDDAKNADTKTLERQLSTLLGEEVNIQHDARAGSGKITLRYCDLDKLTEFTYNLGLTEDAIDRIDY